MPAAACAALASVAIRDPLPTASTYLLRYHGDWAGAWERGGQLLPAVLRIIAANPGATFLMQLWAPGQTAEGRPGAVIVTQFTNIREGEGITIDLPWPSTSGAPYGIDRVDLAISTDGSQLTGSAGRGGQPWTGRFGRCP